MAVKKKTNGHDPVTAEMLEVLKSIDRRIDAMDVRFTKALGEAITRIDGTNERLDNLRDETRSNLLDIHADLHEANERENRRDRDAREDRREHEARIAELEKQIGRIVRLEEHVFRKTG